MTKSKDALMVEQYRKVRNMERACILEEIHASQKKKEEEATSKLKPVVDELDKQIKDIQEKEQVEYNAISKKIDTLRRKSTDINNEINILSNEQYTLQLEKSTAIRPLQDKRYKFQHEMDNIRKKVIPEYTNCPAKQPKRLADFDSETENKVLSFLNGKITELEP